MDRKRKIRKRIVIIALCSVVLMLGGIISMQLLADSNLPEMSAARLALAEARRSGAREYAPELFDQAESTIAAARTRWLQEATRWAGLRDWQAAVMLAVEAREIANRAAQRSQQVQDSLRVVNDINQARVSQRLEQLKYLQKRMPVVEVIWKNAAVGEIRTSESRLALERRQYHAAAAKIQEADSLTRTALVAARDIVCAYLASADDWQSWVDRTRLWSAQQQATAIIVDKLSFTCQIYNAGKLTQEFSAELGTNWIGDKNHRGDGTTPEGFYHVKSKKRAGQSKYYKALEINYPNEDDRQRFDSAARNGRLPTHVQIGGLIEIHGDGGKGTNWTEGCVALRNSDMDKAFEAAQVGTPVTIIGTVNSEVLQQLKKICELP